jgi:hypothetical protein
MKVHLVGSIGLDTVEDVFRTVGKELGPHLQRVPDGEIGGRKLWISWQYPLLRASAYLRPDPSGRVRPTNRFPLLTLAEGVAAADAHFGELGYAREARASYLDFVAARDKGELPKVGYSSLPGNNSAGGVAADKNDMRYVADSQSSETPSAANYNPGYQRGIRIGNVNDGKVVYFIPPRCRRTRRCNRQSASWPMEMARFTQLPTTRRTSRNT